MLVLNKEIWSVVCTREVCFNALLTKKALQHAGINQTRRYQEAVRRDSLSSRSLTRLPTMMKHASGQDYRKDEEPNQHAIQNLELHMGFSHAASLSDVHNDDSTLSDVWSHSMAPPTIITLNKINFDWNHW